MLKNTRLFSKKIILIGLLLTNLIFPAVILAQELKGVVIRGILSDSTDPKEVEMFEGSEGIAKTFDSKLVWTYDQTDIITGSIGTLSVAKDIASPVNGLEEPLLSQLSGYQERVIAHCAGATTAVVLAKEGKMWGDKLYAVSPAMISQEELRTIRDLTAQGKGFKEIIVYTGDDMIPNFKELHTNFKDYTINAKITEDWEVSLTKVLYEDRGQKINILEKALNDFATRTKAQFGKEPVSITIYGDIPGNKLEIKWEDGTMELFNLQKDSQTGKDFQDEENIKIVPLFEGFPHGRAQLEMLDKFYREKGRMPENTQEDIEYFKELVKEASGTITTAHDPNEKLVSPEGDIKPGDRLNYTINYENEGEGIAYGVYITDTLEEDLDDSALTVNNEGVYDRATRTIKWFIGELGSKQKGSVSFGVNAKSDLTDGAEVINFATVYFPSVPEATRTNGTVNRVTTVIDNVPPTTIATISPLPNPVGWNNTDVTITLTAADNEGGSGLSKTEYSLDNINWTIYTTPFTITNEGTTTVYYKSTDNLNNIESSKSLEIKLDKTPPTITSQVSPQPNSSGWNNTDVTVAFNATDILSGVSSVTQPQTITTEGANQNIGGEAIDLADNRTSTFVTLNIDKTPPTITAQASPSANSAGWNNTDVTVSFSAEDNLSGIQSLTSPITVTTEGTNQVITGEAIDFADNRITTSITLNIDKTPPQISITASPNTLWPPDHKMLDVAINGNAWDTLSGIASTVFSVEDEYNIIEPNISTFGSIIQLESWREGNDLDGRIYTISVTTKDKAENQASNSTTVICPHDQGKK